MRSLNDTLIRLAALPAGQKPISQAERPDPLTDPREFGSNPGALKARFYVPGELNESAALVVVRVIEDAPRAAGLMH